MTNAVNNMVEPDIIDLCRFPPLYWLGCYGSDMKYRKLVTKESYKHPAKASFQLINRIYEHLEYLNLLKQGDTVVDFMAGTGRINLLAAARGYKTVAVELEPHFIRMIEANKAAAEKHLGRTVDLQVIQGDARNLSKLLTERGVAVVSPPYTDNETPVYSSGTMVGGGLTEHMKTRGERNRRYGGAGVVSPPYAQEQHSRFKKNPVTMQKMRFRESRTLSEDEQKHDGTPILEQGQEDASDNRRTESGLEGRRESARNRENPEQELAEASNENIGERQLHLSEVWDRGLRSSSPEALGPQRAGDNRRLSNTLQEMSLQSQRGYATCHHCGKWKVPRGKTIDQLGYRIVDYHRAVLFRVEEKATATLDGGVKESKSMKGRVSFFKRLSVTKGNVAAQWEDIIFAVRDG